MVKQLTGIAILTLSLVSCLKTEPVSPVPEITFLSLELALIDAIDQLTLVGVLKFDFIDGDADIGIEKQDAANPNLPDSLRYNLFLAPYAKIDGKYFFIEYDEVPPHYTIFRNSKLDRVGQNKTIKGTITYVITDLPDYDTIRYDFMLRDRAGNNSNLESTTDLGTRVSLNDYYW